MKKHLLTLFSALSLSMFSYGQTYSLIEGDFGSFSAPGSKTVVMSNLSVTITSPALNCEVLDELFANVSNLPYTVSPTQDTVLFIHNITNDTYLNLTIDLPGVSVEENNKVNFTVYPNPTTDLLIIKGDNISLVEIYDLSGKLLLMTTDKSIDVSALENGFYMVHVNHSFSLQIIKN